MVGHFPLLLWARIRLVSWRIGPLLLYGKGKGRGGILFLGVKRFIFGRVPGGAIFLLGLNLFCPILAPCPGHQIGSFFFPASDFDFPSWFATFAQLKSKRPKVDRLHYFPTFFVCRRLCGK